MPSTKLPEGSKPEEELAKAAWDQYISDLNAAEDEDGLFVLIDKYVRHPRTRAEVRVFVEAVFLRVVPRDAARLLLKTVYQLIGEAFAHGFDSYGPRARMGLAGAANSQRVRRQEAIDRILTRVYGKA
jgi:hypothetical protein